MGREGDSSLWTRSVKAWLRRARDSIHGRGEAKLDHLPVEVVPAFGEDIAVGAVRDEAELLRPGRGSVEAPGVLDGDDFVELTMDEKDRVGRLLDAVQRRDAERIEAGAYPSRSGAFYLNSCPVMLRA